MTEQNFPNNQNSTISDGLYLELKRRDTVIAKWVTQIAQKTGVQIDLAELDKF